MRPRRPHSPPCGPQSNLGKGRQGQGSREDCAPPTNPTSPSSMPPTPHLGSCTAGHLPHSSLVSTWLQRDNRETEAGLACPLCPPPSFCSRLSPARLVKCLPCLLCPTSTSWMRRQQVNDGPQKTPAGTHVHMSVPPPLPKSADYIMSIRDHGQGAGRARETAMGHQQSCPLTRSPPGVRACWVLGSPSCSRQGSRIPIPPGEKSCPSSD